jgi:hypothetical protein
MGKVQAMEGMRLKVQEGARNKKDSNLKFQTSINNHWASILILEF